MYISAAGSSPGGIFPKIADIFSGLVTNIL